MAKDTAKLVEELGLSPDFKTFYNENKDYLLCDSLATLLNDLLQAKGLKKSGVIRQSQLNENYAYQIFSGLRVPERPKLLCLAVAMELNIDQVQTLLKCAGFAQLYVKQPADSVVLYGLCNRLSVAEINDLLFEYELETLG